MDFIYFNFINYCGTGCIRRLVKCQFGQCRRPIKYHGVSAMCDIYPRTNNNDRKYWLSGWYCTVFSNLSSFGNVERVSLLDMPTH